MAEHRTDWAEDRTILANERTFAGWMRTAMASLALAVGLRAIFGELQYGFYPARICATIFVGTAILIFWMARQKSVETLQRLNDHAARALRPRNVTLLCALLSAGSVGIGLLLWLI